MLETARAYLAFIDNPPRETAQRLVALAEILDRLAMAYHQCAEVRSTADAEPPELNHEKLREAVAPRFPELGIYATIEPGALDDLGGEVGDAIDDLAHIANEMRQVDWLAKNTNLDEATWQFRFGYRTHWGRHLMELRRHIHVMLYQA